MCVCVCMCVYVCVCVCVCVCVTLSQLTLKTEATSDIMLKILLYPDVWFYCTPYNSMREPFRNNCCNKQEWETSGRVCRKEAETRGSERCCTYRALRQLYTAAVINTSGTNLWLNFSHVNQEATATRQLLVITQIKMRVMRTDERQ
jgi:hypothetical protein